MVKSMKMAGFWWDPIFGGLSLCLVEFGHFGGQNGGFGGPKNRAIFRQNVE